MTPIPSDVDLGSHALAYARAGLEVLPLLPGGKLPHKLALHAKDSASAGVELVRDWWVQAPDANIRLRPPEGVVVLDVDPRSGGATELHALTRRHGGLSPTWTAHTGGGGLHAWYRASGPFKSKLCPGVDLKSHTGYVVAPPSLHASGRRYSWANEYPITTAPRWLAGLAVAKLIPPATVMPRSSSAASADGLVRTVIGAKPGGRNDALHWAACRAAERGSPADLVERLRAAALGVGLPAFEVDRTIASALGMRGAA